MRKQTKCLDTALERLAQNPVEWQQPAGPLDLDDYDVLAGQFYSIVLEQETMPAGFRRGGRTPGSELCDESELRLNGAELEETLPETVGPTVYSTKWTRVPDEVFAQYAPIEQRRPACR